MKPYLLGNSGAWALTTLLLNVGDFVACSVFFIVMLAVLAHRLVWPVLDRPMYALHRYGVIRKKKFLWAFAVALFVGPHNFAALAKYIAQHV
jgi:hypothetical protein